MNLFGRSENGKKIKLDPLYFSRLLYILRVSQNSFGHCKRRLFKTKIQGKNSAIQVKVENIGKWKKITD